jgi:hypothetical protein
MTPRDTKLVQGRRSLQLASLREVGAEADRLAALESAARLTALGNWRLGQVFGHLASWMSYPFDGYPMTTPWFMPLFRPLLRRQLLGAGPMPVGVRIPKAPDGTYGTEPLSTSDGLKRLHTSIARLDTTCPSVTNPVLGRLTHDEWKLLNIKHANLHLSFFVES